MSVRYMEQHLCWHLADPVSFSCVPWRSVDSTLENTNSVEQETALPAQGSSEDQMTAMLIPSPSPRVNTQNFRTPDIWARDEGLMAVWAVTETAVTSRWHFYCNEQHLYAFVSLSQAGSSPTLAHSSGTQQRFAE